MENLLDFFRKQMAAFEGSANPSKAIESGYYVPEPGKSVSDLIAARIALRPTSTHLILGGIGSGKTTQLLLGRDRIDELLENAYVRYIDVSLSTDISKIAPGVLVAIVGVTLANLMKDSEDDAVKKDVEHIQKIAYGYTETNETLKSKRDQLGAIPLPFPKYFESDPFSKTIRTFKRHPGILSPASKQQSNKLISAVKNLYETAKKKHDNVVFLFDGLDRLDDNKSFSQMIVSDMQELSAIGIGSVVVGSVRIMYEEFTRSTLEQSVDYFEYKSCWDVENDPSAYAFFESILKQRATEGFIESDAIGSIIRYSGGILRDLINITQASIEEAYLIGDESLKLIHVKKAVETFGRGKLLGLTKSDIDTLQEFANGRLLPPSSDDEIKLLITRRIIEYMYPERRCIVHPTLLPILSLAMA
jgi:intracellular sulfur oxidation DsrE/DsrF family protein